MHGNQLTVPTFPRKQWNTIDDMVVDGPPLPGAAV